LQGAQTWFVGNDMTRDDCTARAIGYFNALNAESPNRAFSWACRKMQREKFQRVR
jgi:hypothetical protein